MSGIYEKVLARVEPKEMERKKTLALAKSVSEQLVAILRSQGIEAEVNVEGSVAKDTWLASERDIDIFVLLPPTGQKEVFLRVIDLAKRLGRKWRMQYADHPYLQLRVEGHQIEIIPAFKVSSASELASAVDRTPFHTRHVRENLDERKRRDVRLLKSFMKGIGCYGAEFRTQGFSGYLCELLVINYGNFPVVVEAAKGWRQGAVIDVGRKYPNEAEPKALFENQPLIVIDSVDQNRNVAAAVSLQNFATFVQACRDFSRSPDIRFFFPKRVKLLSPAEFRQMLKRRGTKLYCMLLQHPDIPEDVIYPQLSKTERSLIAKLVQTGFEVMRSDVWADRNNAAVLLELASSRLPNMQNRPGPVVSIDTNVFISEHVDSKRRVAGPFVDQVGRVVFEITRSEVEASKNLRLAISEKEGFGKNIAEAVDRKYRLLEDREISSFFKNRSFHEFVSDYLTRCLPWYRR